MAKTEGVGMGEQTNVSTRDPLLIGGLMRCCTETFRQIAPSKGAAKSGVLVAQVHDRAAS